MNLLNLARRSTYSVATWEDAERVLHTAGFSKEDTEVVLKCALRNALPPIKFARAAVQLREHVLAGSPIGTAGGNPSG